MLSTVEAPPAHVPQGCSSICAWWGCEQTDQSGSQHAQVLEQPWGTLRFLLPMSHPSPYVQSCADLCSHRCCIHPYFPLLSHFIACNPYPHLIPNYTLHPASLLACFWSRCNHRSAWIQGHLASTFEARRTAINCNQARNHTHLH